MRLTLPLTALLVLGLAACGSDADEAASNPILTEGSDMAAAESHYDSSAFDTIAWADQADAVARGEEMWRYACVECHGPAGEGDGGFVEDGDTLRPPSFRVEGWRYADDKQALLHQIYVGTDREMPHWGLRRMHPRDMDAVATYILEELSGPPAGS
ncbi:MAG TPA: c-type cytochrome [Longimicrobiales bacterium]|nr:c-type cytochrome [Longimicrobiales bacterium]